MAFAMNSTAARSFTVTVPKKNVAAQSAKCQAVTKAALPSRAFFGNTKALSTKTCQVQSRRMVIVQADGREKIAEGYASALADVATGANSLEAVHADMENLEAILDEDVILFLGNPIVPPEKKLGLITKMAKEASFTPYTTNFLKLLVDKKRIELVGDMIPAFEKLYCELTQTEVAVVTSAIKLENEEQFLIAKRLQELTGAKNIKLKPSIDDSILAGFIVRYGENGSNLLDQSLKAKLNTITTDLTSLELS